MSEIHQFILESIALKSIATLAQDVASHDEKSKERCAKQICRVVIEMEMLGKIPKLENMGELSEVLKQTRDDEYSKFHKSMEDYTEKLKRDAAVEMLNRIMDSEEKFFIDKHQMTKRVEEIIKTSRLS